MKQMHTMRRTIVLLLSALLLTSCGLLRPVDAEEKVPAETGTPVQDAETEAAVQTEENELSSAALTFDSILADYEARQNGSKEEKADNKPEEPEHISAPSESVTPVSVDTTDASARPETSYSKYDLDDSIPADALRVTLSGTSAEFTGDGLSLTDGVLTIGEAGVYLFTGDFAGQILVDAGEEAHVRLILAGVSLHDAMAPLYIVSADKVVLTLADGTENSVSDSVSYVFADGEDEPDAAVFSKEDLTINGTGALSVNGNYADGIVSKDDLKIVSGTIRVNAVHNGIKGKDSLSVRDGVIDVSAGNDAMKASNDSEEDRGWVIFEGGDTTISAGDDAIHAETWLLVYGGTIAVAKSYEGLEAMKIEVYGGDVSVVSADDAINAASGSSDDFGGFGGWNFGGFGGFGGQGGFSMPNPSTSGTDAPPSEGTDSLFGGRGGGGRGNGGGFGGGFGEEPEDGVWILIAGGTVRAQGGNDILDTNGTFTQTGGTVIAVGANMSIYGEPDAIIDTNGSAEITGGTFAAFCRGTGSRFAGILSSPAVACSSLNSAETVTLADADGNTLVSFENGTRAQNVVISSDQMTAGQDYLLILDSRTIAFTAENGVQAIR